MSFLFQTYPDLHVTPLRKAEAGLEIWTETTAAATGLEMAVVAIRNIDETTGTPLGGRFYSEPVRRDGPDIDHFMPSIGATQTVRAVS
jgi:hypothetical protein